MGDRVGDYMEEDNAAAAAHGPDLNDDEDDELDTLGTTTAGITLTQLVILGADRKGSKYDVYGNEIIEEKNKVFELVPDLAIGVTRAGSEVHSDKMIKKLREIAIRYQDHPELCNIQMLARQAFEEIRTEKILKNFHQGNILMGGPDKEGEPCLIYINNSVCMDLRKSDIPEIKDKFQTGSGSGSASIFLNTYKYSKDAPQEDGVAYMQDLVYNSICHDSHSGIGIDVLVIGPTGCQPVIHLTVEEYECLRWMQSYTNYPFDRKTSGAAD